LVLTEGVESASAFEAVVSIGSVFVPAGLSNVGVDISIVLGRSRMPIHQLLRMGRGAVIALDSAEGDEVEILANDLPIARGMVVVNGTSITVEVKELLKRPDSERTDAAKAA
jgi:flagellar motor switch protein FliN/FliY